MRDLSGDIKSVLFYPDPSAIGGFEFSDLRAGCTLCIRYAQRCFFSDLATEAIKVGPGGGRDLVGTRLATEMVTTGAGEGGG